MPESEKLRLTVYSEEVIEAFLKGDRRDIDKLLLHGLNNLGIALLEHADREEKVFSAMGDVEIIKRRSDWIDSQIEKARMLNEKTAKRIEMMDKVKSSTVVWAVIAFLGYLSHIAVEAAIAWWKSRGHS